MDPNPKSFATNPNECKQDYINYLKMFVYIPDDNDEKIDPSHYLWIFIVLIIVRVLILLGDINILRIGRKK